MQQQRQPIILVEEFFYDDSNTPWEPLPEHGLDQVHVAGTSNTDLSQKNIYRDLINC